MEDSLNSYLEEITAYLKDNFLLIFATKSSVTLFTPDTHQAKTHPKILIEDSRLPLVQCPTILGFNMYTSLSFNNHSSHVTERVSGRRNILKALAVTEHSELLSAQYLARCLEPENINFSITTRQPPKRMMKETIFSRHRSAVEPLMIAKDRKTTLQAIHYVNQVVTSLGRNVVLDDRPPEINISEKELTRK